MRALTAATVLALLVSVVPIFVASAEEAAPVAARSTLNVNQLFATTCGWCHANAGRTAGKGPQLMDSKRSDDFIRYRIKHGKEGGMPAFGASFTDADIDQIIAYIRALKPEQGTP
jgi:mono/diheme cytochrome c family protein